MTGKGKGKARQQRRALSVTEKQQICKKRLEPQHTKESLSVFGAHYPDERGEPVKTSTMSDVLKESAKWLAVDVATGGKFLTHW